MEASDNDLKSNDNDTETPDLNENSPKCPSSDVYSDPLAPQLRIDANGNIVLDETSLLVEKRENFYTKTLRHISEETGILSVDYRSFRPPRDGHGRKWTERETTRFYRALSTIGTDFYVMEKMFPRRKRSELVVSCPSPLGFFPPTFVLVFHLFPSILSPCYCVFRNCFPFCDYCDK